MRISRLLTLSPGKSLLILIACTGQVAINPAIGADSGRLTVDTKLLSGGSANPGNADVDSTPPLKPSQPTSPSGSVSPAAASTTTQQTQPFQDPFDQPTSDAKHDINKILDVEKLRLHSAVHKYSFEPVRLEIQFDQPITLEEALRYAVDNNLPIKISRENYRYQRYLFFSQVANAAPNFSMSYNLTRTKILNKDSSALARVFLPRVSYPVFQGGSVLFSILGQYCRAKGWHKAYYASVNDAMLDVYQKYNNLLLNRVLLQIRAKAVEVSEEQLKVNQSAERVGTNTRFAVMQSETQLAADRQALLQQEVTVRQAALALNFSLNYPMAVNLVPVEETISESPLFQARANIRQLVYIALDRRPELREYELFKFAAARNVQVASAPLYPSMTFFTQYSYTNTTSNQTSSTQAGAGVFGGLFETYQQGLGLVWNLPGFGLPNMANIASAQALNRQASIQANQELQTVLQQVRSSFLSWRAAREQIDNAARGVASSGEALRIAEIRLREGVGTNLELIQAQRDYINALTTQAQAIVGSNLAQAQLLHDTGIITMDTLLHGYRGGAK
jgi:outer membrane protein TolC